MAGRRLHSKQSKPTMYSEHVPLDHTCEECSRGLDTVNFRVVVRIYKAYVGKLCNTCMHAKLINKDDKPTRRKKFSKKWKEMTWQMNVQ